MTMICREFVIFCRKIDVIVNTTCVFEARSKIISTIEMPLMNCALTMLRAKLLILVRPTSIDA